MEEKTGICRESYKIKGRGIIIFFQHNLSGLEKGTVLFSRSYELKWKIESRILVSYAVNTHRLFENEAFKAKSN